MKKVTYIAPKHVRFADSRTCRVVSFEANLFKREHMKARRKSSARLAHHYIALKQDKRFAAFALQDALRHVPYDPVMYRPLENHFRCLNWNDDWTPLPHDDVGYYRLAAAHASTSDPSKIACYPTRADSYRRREIVMSPGKFYAAAYPRAEAAAVQDMAQSYTALFVPPTAHFITNNDFAPGQRYACGQAWVDVYTRERNFRSCMSDWSPDQSHHPIRFYGLPGNNLALVYLTTDGEPDGPVVARAICNVNTATFVRVYGDNRLNLRLEKLGYSQCPLTSLEGIKCVAYVRNGKLVAPYIDGDMSIDWDWGDDTCTISEDGALHAQNTSGYAGEAGEECDDCGARSDSEDMSTSEYHNKRLCSCCIDNYHYAYVDARNQDYVYKDEVVVIDDESYLDKSEVLSAHGYVYSDYHEEYIQEDDAIHLAYMDTYVLLEDTVELDVPYGDDTRALKHDVKTVQLKRTVVVHENDDSIPEEIIATEVDEGAPAIAAAA